MGDSSFGFLFLNQAFKPRATNSQNADSYNTYFRFVHTIHYQAPKAALAVDYIDAVTNAELANRVNGAEYLVHFTNPIPLVCNCDCTVPTRVPVFGGLSEKLFCTAPACPCYDIANIGGSVGASEGTASSAQVLGITGLLHLSGTFCVCYPVIHPRSRELCRNDGEEFGPQPVPFSHAHQLRRWLETTGGRPTLGTSECVSGIY